jgi:hypothetical protein
MEALAVREPLFLCSDQGNFQLDFQIIPSRNSPVSSAAFHVRPKSPCLILVVAEAPILAFPKGSFVSADGTSTFRTTSLVTPWIVRSPFKFSSPSPSGVIELLLKMMVGYFSTSRKSALFRCSQPGCRWHGAEKHKQTGAHGIRTTSSRAGTRTATVNPNRGSHCVCRHRHPDFRGTLKTSSGRKMLISLALWAHFLLHARQDHFNTHEADSTIIPSTVPCPPPKTRCARLHTESRPSGGP